MAPPFLVGGCGWEAPAVKGGAGWRWGCRSWNPPRPWARLLLFLVALMSPFGIISSFRAVPVGTGQGQQALGADGKSLFSDVSGTRSVNFASSLPS